MHRAASPLNDATRAACNPAASSVGNCVQLAQLLPMPITLDAIVEETRQWPDEVVAELIDRIVIAKHGGIDAQHAETWAKIAQARPCRSRA